MVRNNIVLVKRETPLRLTLPNGRTFPAKYKRVNRHYLPGSAKIQRTYRSQPVGRRLPAWLKRKKKVPKKGKKQGGKGLGDVVRSIASNPYAQEIGKRALAKRNKLYPIFV